MLTKAQRTALVILVLATLAARIWGQKIDDQLEKSFHLKMSKLQNSLVPKVFQLLESGQTELAMDLMRNMYKSFKRRQYERCLKSLPRYICNKSSGQPFNMWFREKAGRFQGNILGEMKKAFKLS